MPLHASSCPWRERNNHILHNRVFIFQRSPMGRHTFALPVDYGSLGHHVDVGGDGSTCFQRVPDLVLEVSRHAGDMLFHYLENLVTYQVEVVFWIQAQHFHDPVGEELDDQSVIADHEELETRRCSVSSGHFAQQGQTIS